MKKVEKYIPAIIPFILGIGCFVAYGIIGSEIIPDGVLKEPFFLLPMGGVLIITSIISILASFFCSLYSRKKSDK